MKFVIGIITIIISLVILGCGSSDYIQLENNMISAELSPYKYNKPVIPDSSYIANELGPSTNFAFHLAKDDSVTIYYFDINNTALAEPFKLLLSKGDYRCRLKDFKFPQGVYQVSCIIGKIKWRKKFIIMR